MVGKFYSLEGVDLNPTEINIVELHKRYYSILGQIEEEYMKARKEMILLGYKQGMGASEKVKTATEVLSKDVRVLL